MSWAPWDISWDPTAAADLLALRRRDPGMARRIYQAITTLATTGQGDVKKLKGSPPQWRLRVGRWRVIYRPDGRTMHVETVVQRKDAY